MLPLLNVTMPGNAQFLFNQIYAIAAFNIINVDVITHYFAGLFHLEISSEGVSSRLQAMGFDSSNVVTNLGLVFLFLLGFLVTIIFQQLIRCLAKIRCRHQHRLEKANLWISKKLYWNFFIRFYVETYLDQAFV
jgi:hypothetical protein